jgi:cell division protein FtsN
MNNHERENPDDVRVFDGGGDDEEEGGSHLPVVIVISLLVLAAFGGVVWLAYNNGVARGRADAPAVLAAAPSEQPAVAPGSGAIPPKQIKIYQQQAGSDENADQQTASAPPAQLTTPPPALRSHPAETKPAVQTPSAGQAAAKPAPVAQTALPPAATVVKPAAQAPAKQPVAIPAKAPAAASAAGGAYLLQIGAYKSQSDADAAWKTYQAKHAALLSGFGPNVQKADLGDKGVWYRLRVGSFADKGAAAALCDRLKTEGAACFTAK